MNNTYIHVYSPDNTCTCGIPTCLLCYTYVYTYICICIHINCNLCECIYIYMKTNAAEHFPRRMFSTQMGGSPRMAGLGPGPRGPVPGQGPEGPMPGARAPRGSSEGTCATRCYYSNTWRQWEPAIVTRCYYSSVLWQLGLAIGSPRNGPVSSILKD